MTHHIVTLPGDGIGPEIMAPTLELLRRARRLRVRGAPVRRRLDRRPRHALTDEVLAACRAPTPCCSPPSAARSGTRPTPTQPRPEQGLLGLRKGLGLYANLRPVKPLPALYDASPLRRERIEGTDLLVVRELTGGIYFGEKTRTADSRLATSAPTRVEEIERIARTALRRGARARCTSVDKANVLETSRLWREVVSARPRARVPARRARARARRQRRDAARLRAAPLRRDPHREHVRRHPQRRGGDDHRLDRDAAERVARRADGDPGLFEPVHGSAPDIAGQGSRQPAGDVPLGRDDAAPRPRLGKRGGGCRIGG